MLCTVEDKRPYLAELARAVRPSGAVGLLVYARTVDRLPDQPDGNHFPSRAELLADLGAVGLEMVEELPLVDAAAAPLAWQEAADRVEAVIERRHHRDERWQRAQLQQDTITDLIRSGLVVGLLTACRGEPGPAPSLREGSATLSLTP